MRMTALPMWLAVRRAPELPQPVFQIGYRFTCGQTQYEYLRLSDSQMTIETRSRSLGD
jgi:hypothetical protein